MKIKFGQVIWKSFCQPLQLIHELKLYKSHITYRSCLNILNDKMFKIIWSCLYFRPLPESQKGSQHVINESSQHKLPPLSKPDSPGSTKLQQKSRETEVIAVQQVWNEMVLLKKQQQNAFLRTVRITLIIIRSHGLLFNSVHGVVAQHEVSSSEPYLHIYVLSHMILKCCQLWPLVNKQQLYIY